MNSTEELTPARIVKELDKNIVGQGAAKRAVAIALRNRWRRMQVDNLELQDEITPKNILMIGPTGVGKTEISRRLARLAGAPFIKVEATKFTEVGYVGRDVDSIIRDLADVAYEQCRAEMVEEVSKTAATAAHERILDALNLPSEERERKKIALKANEYDEDEEIEIEVAMQSQFMVQDFGNLPGLEEMGIKLQSMMSNMPSSQPKKKRKMKIGAAIDLVTEEEIDSRIEEGDIRDLALTRATESGIVFIDEIDKIANSSTDGSSVDVSRQGVQRDLLPLIEGTTVSTRCGLIDTAHILFIASGSFHFSSPRDLIPELQGRLPIKVELNPLSVEDFAKILDGTEHCLVRQYEALLKTEGVTVRFKPQAVRRIAEIAQMHNDHEENIGARRLHALMEDLLEELSFSASEQAGKSIVFDTKMVDAAFRSLNGRSPSSRFII